MLAYLFLAVLPTAWIIAAVNDVAELKIPNWISLALLGLYPVAALYFGSGVSEITQTFLLGAGVLLLGFCLFAINVFGAGDAKLIAASSLWVGLPAFTVFIFKVAVVGGVMAFALILLRRVPVLPNFAARSNTLFKLHQSGKQMPYGLAIAGGGLWSLSDTQFVQMLLGY